MATVTHVTTIDHVAKILGEDQELLEAICELAIIGTAGQLKQTAPPVGPAIAAGGIAVAIAIGMGEIGNGNKIGRMIIHPAQAICFVRVIAKIAVNAPQSLGPVVKILLQPRVLSRLLPHLSKKVNQPLSCVELPRNDPQIQLSGDGRQLFGACIRKYGRQPITC